MPPTLCQELVDSIVWELPRTKLAHPPSFPHVTRKRPRTSQLFSLQLHIRFPLLRVYHKVPEAASPVNGPRIALDRFILEGVNRVSQLLSCAPFSGNIAKLRNLSVVLGERVGFNMLSAAASTVEHIRFSCQYTQTPMIRYILPALPSLRSFDLTLQVEQLLAPWCIPAISDLLPVAASPSLCEYGVMRALEKVIVETVDTPPRIRWRVEEGGVAGLSNGFSWFFPAWSQAVQQSMPKLLAAGQVVNESSCKADTAICGLVTMYLSFDMDGF
ncbi:hypothetical protein C8R46DRAFT_1210107 [Mycena filopes]|nr:hypothetical protein C8R46DRAFT_1210107 [Mycena filopes]